MLLETVFEAIQKNPLDELAWTTFGDICEDQGDTEMVSLLRESRTQRVIPPRVRQHIRQSFIRPGLDASVTVRPIHCHNPADLSVVPKSLNHLTRNVASVRIKHLQPSRLTYTDCTIVTRGPFIVFVEMWLRDWCEIIDLELLFSRNPIGFVHLSDAVEPTVVGSHVMYRLSDRPASWAMVKPRVPREILCEIPHSKLIRTGPYTEAVFFAEEQAIAAMSKAAIKYARKKIHAERKAIRASKKRST